MAPRKLVICCDGTWQKIKKTYPTNVAKMKFAIEAAGRKDQIVYYHPGLGTENWFTKIFGGAFGLGLNKDIAECYAQLCSMYQAGDYIYLFGFSRGAYTVRSLGGLIYKCGLLRRPEKELVNDAMHLYRESRIHPDDPAAVEFRNKHSVAHADNDNRPLITFLGCWDTVGSLGVPDLNPRWKLDEVVNKPFQFHDTKLSRIIRNARHAVGLDEHRKVFDVTPMVLSESARAAGNVLKQFWFTGDHGCVGGGDRTRESLSDITFYWMATEALGLGGDKSLSLDMTRIPKYDALDYRANFTQEVDALYKATGLIDRKVTDEFSELFWSVKARLKADPAYNPPQVRAKFKDLLEAWAMGNVGQGTLPV